MKLTEAANRSKEIIKEMKPVGIDKYETGCEYFLKNNKRTCSMTSNRSCEGCKFFSPNFSTKIIMLAEKIAKLEKIIVQLELENRKLKNK